MSTLSMQDVEQIALLARLHLTEEEKLLYQQQLSDVLTYVEQLADLNLDNVPPTAHAVSQQNIVRDDVINSSLSPSAALANAAATEADQFAIQAVFGEKKGDNGK